MFSKHISVPKGLLEEWYLIKYSRILTNRMPKKKKWTSLVELNLVEQNSLPFLYHAISESKPHPEVQQMLLNNSSSVQRRIPNSEHACWASENVTVRQPISSLSQDSPS